MKNLILLQKAIFMAFLFLCTSFLHAQSLDDQVESQEKKYLEEKTKLEDLRFKWIEKKLKAVGTPVIKDTKLKNRKKNVFHETYMLNYNETHEQANWVAHIILPQIFEFCGERTEDFRPDPAINTGSADDRIYSGLLKNKTDRGHLAPAADLRWSMRAVSSSFYYSNMSPQSSSLNQGKWADLEKMLRAYVKFYDSPLIIVSGAVLKDLNTGTVKKLNNIPDGVSVPKRYFKIAYDPERNRGVGFVLEQKTSKRKSFSTLIKSIDEVEVITGMNFLGKISKAKQDRAEAQKNLELWNVLGDIKAAKPYPVSKLPSGALNTSQLKDKIESLLNKKVTVCAKVIKTSVNEKDGYVNLTLDDKKKNVVYIRIDKENIGKFDAPEVEYRGMNVKATGTVVKKSSFGKSYYYVVVKSPKDLKEIK